MVAAGQPYVVAVARRTDNELIFCKWNGNKTRHPSYGEFETIMKKVLGAPSMKSLAEKILKVEDMKMYVAYRKDENYGPDGGIVYFIITPLSYNKGELRKLLKEVQEAFKTGMQEGDVDEEKLSTAQEHELNKRSSIKKAIEAAVEKYGEGVAMTDKILQQLDKNKALVSENIAASMARIEQLEDTLEMTEQLVESTSAFADKANKIKMAMAMKNLKMLIGLVILCAGCIALLLHQMGVF